MVDQLQHCWVEAAGAYQAESSVRRYMLAVHTYWEHRWWEHTDWLRLSSLLFLPRTLQNNRMLSVREDSKIKARLYWNKRTQPTPPPPCPERCNEKSQNLVLTCSWATTALRAAGTAHVAAAGVWTTLAPADPNEEQQQQEAQNHQYNQQPVWGK